MLSIGCQAQAIAGKGKLTHAEGISANIDIEGRSVFQVLKHNWVAGGKYIYCAHGNFCRTTLLCKLERILEMKKKTSHALG